MSTPKDLSISFSRSVSTEDQAELLQLFEKDYDVSDGGKNFAGDWAMYFVLAKDALSFAADVAGIAVVAQQVIEWRRRMKAAGRPHDVVIKVADGDEVRLATDADADIARKLS